MAMTGEQIYHNFDSGNPLPLADAADSVVKLAGSYQGIAQKFEAAQNRMMRSWTGGAAQAASHGAAPLAPAMRLSAEHLSGYASAHSQQSQAFSTAKQIVQPVPPMPAALDPMELIRIGMTGGIGAELEAIKSHQDAVAAHNAAAEHNVRVMDGYRGATDVNRNMPADYPWPKWGGSTFSTEDDGGEKPGGEKPGGDGGGDSRDGGGSGGPAGGGFSGSGGGLPGGAVEPSSVGTLPPTKDVDDAWTNRRLDPPPTTPPPPTDPPVTLPPKSGDTDKDRDKDTDKDTDKEPEGPEPPDWPGPDLGDDDVDDGTAPASSSSGDTSAWRDGSGNWGPAAGAWGAGDRAGGDASRAGGPAFGPGGPGAEFGAGRGAGAAAGAGFRPGTAGGRGGAGGFGGAVPPRGRGDEDDEHNRPEYLVEPDPNSLFGTDEQASSPVIGEAWKPE